MSSLIIVAIVVSFLAQLAAILLLWRHVRSTELSVARLKHEIAMDAAVLVYKLTATEAAVTWMRDRVDEHATRTLGRHLGADGYERYLIGLHRKLLVR